MKEKRSKCVSEIDQLLRKCFEQNPKGENRKRLVLHHRMPDGKLVFCDGSKQGRIVTHG